MGIRNTFVQNGNAFNVYDDYVKTYDQLPVGTYNVIFIPKQGFLLEKTDDFVITEKAYGVHNEKIEKVFRVFQKSERNLGIILSGDKGIGKSMFAKLLANRFINDNNCAMPVLLVNEYVAGIAQFLASIKQPLMVIFDEFDKTFYSNSSSESKDDPQTEMLTLFDGTTDGKNLFVITCNRTTRLNDYMINRPGRFHYHFRFDYPKPNEIREYLSDHFVCDEDIENIIKFASKVSLNYDCLRAIAFEINTGSSFKEAMEDLNIMNMNNDTYSKVLIKFSNGEIFKYDYRIDMFDTEEVEIEVEDSKNHYATIGELKFDTTDMYYDTMHYCHMINGDNINFKFAGWFEDYTEGRLNSDDLEYYKKTYDRFRDTTIVSVGIRKAEQKNYHYLV